MMNRLIFPLAECRSWRHTALFCFPQIESRKVFAEKLDLSDSELKVRFEGNRIVVPGKYGQMFCKF